MSDETNYNVITVENGVPIKAWTRGVALEDQARKQLLNVAQLPFIFKWVAAMPDVHWGIGATVGSVIPTKGAIIPAAVGVDIGCGMMAVQTDLNARDLPDNLKDIRSAIEKAVPHGRTNHGGRGDVGAWGEIPARNNEVWQTLKPRYDAILEKHPKLDRGNHSNHLGTLGTGNHFIEVCLDEAESVWFMLHSGSRGVGNRMGIIPVSMGTRSYIVRGKGNMETFMSCSHGAGRAMSRTEAKRRFTVEDHKRMTLGVECRKDAEVIDETPAAYKSIEAVMAAQRDLVEVVHTLRQVVCVKG